MSNQQIILILSILVIILFLVCRGRRATIRDLEKSNNELRNTTREQSCKLSQAAEEQARMKVLLERYGLNLGLKSTSHDIVGSLAENYRTMKCERDKAVAALQTHEKNLNTLLASNLTSAPWLAGMMADFLTYDLEVEAKKLDWGHNIQREKKVADIREIRADTRHRIEEAKTATYQLEYLRALYPSIDDVLETDYKELDFSKSVFDSDPTRRFLSKEEWNSLSSAEKDQLALDRYVQSRSKSNWQIGRDYELSVCYEYIKKGYSVTTFGSFMGLEDLGRDLIARKPGFTLIIQCKYWSQCKTIHEKHIFQLYGTVVSYKIEHPQLSNQVQGLFVTNTKLSDMARKVSDVLGIVVVENHPMIDFPRIKCNIGRDEYGETKIYHLPMDSQYDVTQISKPGEFYAFTVYEAMEHGFRRAYKWHGSQ